MKLRFMCDRDYSYAETRGVQVDKTLQYFKECVGEAWKDPEANYKADAWSDSLEWDEELKVWGEWVSVPEYWK